MPIKGIDHWVIVASDLDRTLAFYERLGFTIAWEKRPGRPDMATIRINDAQKINVHAPRRPNAAGYLGARRPTAAAPTCA
jgi:catechol 2,3-dioxygenase-like lactoylglutathione lyase family enzyme